MFGNVFDTLRKTTLLDICLIIHVGKLLGVLQSILMVFNRALLIPGPPESMREHVVAAFKAMKK